MTWSRQHLLDSLSGGREAVSHLFGKLHLDSTTVDEMQPVMEPLSREFVDRCRCEEDRIFCAYNASRLATRVGAACTFGFSALSIGAV
ncbi:MAG TPA: hypothetical protein DEF79_01050 [Gammaproteobacteria bacterium]|nr:hypothetical protein [Gammaproteobacteria bacterium]